LRSLTLFINGNYLLFVFDYERVTELSDELMEDFIADFEVDFDNSQEMLEEEIEYTAETRVQPLRQLKSGSDNIMIPIFKRRLLPLVPVAQDVVVCACADGHVRLMFSYAEPLEA
jgi:hypothetical protein